MNAVHEAELATLGGIILRGGDELDEVREVLVDGADDFATPIARSIFLAMVAVREQGIAFDHVTIAAQLERSRELEFVGGFAEVAGLDRHATISPAREHALIVREASVRRRATDYLRRAVARVSDPDSDPFESLGHVLHDLAEMAAAAHGGSGLVTMRQACAEAWRQLEIRADPARSPVVRYGFRSVDAVIAGALPAELVVLAAATGHGKSALAGAIARSQVFTDARQRGRFVPHARPKWTLFASNEQQPYELALRWMSEQAMIDSANFRSPSPEWWGTHRDPIRTGFRAIDGVPITVAYRSGYTLDEFLLDARLWHRRTLRELERLYPRDDPRSRMGPVISDFLQRWIVTGSLARESRERQVGEIARAHKDLAVELGVPVFALAQINDDARTRGGRPIASDIRESKAVAHHADTIGMFWRPERALPDAERDARRRELRTLDGFITHGERLTDEQTKRYRELFSARLLARLAFDKMRGGPADDIFSLEFLPEFTRVLDAIEAREGA